MSKAGERARAPTAGKARTNRLLSVEYMDDHLFACASFWDLFGCWMVVDRDLRRRVRKYVLHGGLQRRARARFAALFHGRPAWINAWMQAHGACMAGSLPLSLWLHAHDGERAGAVDVSMDNADWRTGSLGTRATWRPRDVDLYLPYTGEHAVNKTVASFSAAATGYYRALRNHAGSCHGVVRDADASEKQAYLYACPQLRRLRTLYMRANNDPRGDGGRCNSGGSFEVQLLFVDWSAFATLDDFFAYSFDVPMCMTTYDGRRVRLLRACVTAFAQGRALFRPTVPSIADLHARLGLAASPDEKHVISPLARRWRRAAHTASARLSKYHDRGFHATVLTDAGATVPLSAWLAAHQDVAALTNKFATDGADEDADDDADVNVTIVLDHAHSWRFRVSSTCATNHQLPLLIVREGAARALFLADKDDFRFALSASARALVAREPHRIEHMQSSSGSRRAWLEFSEALLEMVI